MRSVVDRNVVMRRVPISLTCNMLKLYPLVIFYPMILRQITSWKLKDPYSRAMPQYLGFSGFYNVFGFCEVSILFKIFLIVNYFQY